MVTSSPESTPIVTQEGAHRALSAIAIIQTRLPYAGKMGANALVDQVGGSEVWKALNIGSETFIRGATKPELPDSSAIYAHGVRVGFFATLAAARMDKGITEANIANALTTVSSKHPGNPDYDTHLTEIIGGEATYESMASEVQEFVERYPDLHTSTTASKYLSSIWLGMFAGAAAVHNPTGELSPQW